MRLGREGSGRWEGERGERGVGGGAGGGREKSGVNLSLIVCVGGEYHIRQQFFSPSAEHVRLIQGKLDLFKEALIKQKQRPGSS